MQPSCSPAQADRDLPSLADLGESSDTKSHFPPPTLGSVEQQGLGMQLWHGASAMRWDLMDNWGAGALGNGLPGKPAGTGPFPQPVTPLWIQGNLWDWTEFTSWKFEPLFPNFGELGNQGIRGEMLNSRHSGHISCKIFLPPCQQRQPCLLQRKLCMSSLRVQSWHSFWCKMPNESRVKTKNFAWMQHSRAQGFPAAPSRASLGARSNTVSNWARIWAFMCVCVMCVLKLTLFSPL